MAGWMEVNFFPMITGLNLNDFSPKNIPISSHKGNHWFFLVTLYLLEGAIKYRGRITF